MKKIKSNLVWLFSLIFLSSMFISCDKEPEVEPIDLFPNLNGLYVYGTNTVATSAGNAASKMNLAVLDPGKGIKVNTLEKVFGKYIHIGANGTLSFAWVVNEEGVILGSPSGGKSDSSFVAGGTILDKVTHGDLVEGAPSIKVANAGLYYLFVDINTMKFSLTPIKANIIGDATELQWAAGTSLPLKSSDTLSTVFEATNLPLFGATGYRYRFNNGWHFFESVQTATLSSLGVVSYGAAWDSGINNLGFFLDNIPHKETGLFTVTLTYDAKTAEWKEVKTKTGNLLKDYTSKRFGWFGNAYYASGTTEGAWDAIHLTKLPKKVGNLYHWEWELQLIEGRSFVLREDAEGGAWITYGGAGKVGKAFDDLLIKKEDGQDNYFVAKGGTYIVTFTINAEDEGRLLTILPKA